MEEEFAVQALYGDGNDIFARDEVERCVGMIKKGLRFESLERNDFEAARAGNAELATKEVYRRRLGGNVKFLSTVVSSEFPTKIFATGVECYVCLYHCLLP